MKRRNFITLLGGTAATWPLFADAQERQRPVIGFLSSGSAAVFKPFVAAFHLGLRKQGYDEQRDLSFEYRWAEGHNERLDVLADELVQKQVKLIAATGGAPSARAAMKTTATIPIVFVIGPDPTSPGVNLVASLSRPGGNATGATLFSTLVATKRLEMLGDALQFGKGAITVGIIVNAASVTADVEIMETKEAAKQMNAAYGSEISIVPLMAGKVEEIEKAFELAAQQKVAALLVSADPFFTLRKEQIVMLAESHKIPTMYPWREYVQAGGLMSYGTELSWGYEVVGDYAGRILKGAKPMDLPIQQPTNFDLTINLKTAKSLGLKIGPKALPLAVMVIE